MIDQEKLNAIGDPGLLVSNHQLVEDLQRAVQNAPRDIRGVCLSVREVLRRDPPAFTDRLDPHRGRRWQLPREAFLRFVTDPLPDGLGTDVELLRRLLKDDPEALVMFEQAISRGAGNPSGENQHTRREGGSVDIVHNSCPAMPPRPTGNTQSAAIRRLAKSRPDLLEKVESGELTAHRAMVLAGFRREATPLDLLRRAWAKADTEERETFLSEVNR